MQIKRHAIIQSTVGCSRRSFEASGDFLGKHSAHWADTQKTQIKQREDGLLIKLHNIFGFSLFIYCFWSCWCSSKAYPNRTEKCTKNIGFGTRFLVRFATVNHLNMLHAVDNNNVDVTKNIMWNVLFHILKRGYYQPNNIDNCMKPLWLNLATKKHATINGKEVTKQGNLERKPWELLDGKILGTHWSGFCTTELIKKHPVAGYLLHLQTKLTC